MIPLTLSGEQIDRLATNRPGPSELAILRAAQDSKRRLLLLALRRKLETLRRSEAEAGFALLERAEAVDPAAVKDILDRPLVDAWLARCIWGLKHHGPAAPEVVANIGFVGAVAAAAAARAGIDFELPVPALDGVAFLPDVGGVSSPGDEWPVVRMGAAGVEVFGARMKAHQGDENWRPPHTLSVADRSPWRVDVEDQDPYRDCFGLRPAEYLSDQSLSAFAQTMAAAWRLIEADHPERAATMRASLRGIVPLAAPAGVSGAVLSASSQLAYGSVAVLVPADGPTLARLLIHEVSHMTLSGVMDVEPLYQPTGQAHYHAPWRLDPRPIGQLLQGTFAHVGVTDFWRVHRWRESGAARDLAEFEFIYWRELTARAIGVLAGADELTPVGRRFVRGMKSTMDEWSDEPVDARIAAGAVTVADADGVRWRITNYSSAPGRLRALAETYRAGEPCSTVDSPVVLPRPPIPARQRGLAAIIRDGLCPSAASSATDIDWTPGDRAYLAGDLAGAADAYLRRIESDDADDDAWVGLAMAWPPGSAEPAAAALRARPDLVRELRRLTAAHPRDLARWLAPGIGDGHGDGGSI